jgi:hypothetical protein
MAASSILLAKRDKGGQSLKQSSHLHQTKHQISIYTDEVIPNHRGNFIFNHLKESSGQLQGLGKR